MRTLSAVLLGLALTLSAGAVSSSAATSTCLTVKPSASATACGMGKPATRTVVTLLPLEPGVYQLSITTAKPGGLTKLVRWSPPDDLTITAIKSVENGRCTHAWKQIACVVTKPGRSMAVNFTASSVAPITIDPANIGEPRRSGDVVTVITFLDIPRGLFRLAATDTSGRGFVDAFIWRPPTGMTVTSITSSRGGKCTLSMGSVSCRGSGKRIVPARCDECLPAGSLTVDFYADGLRPPPSGIYANTGVTTGGLKILTLTPVPYHVPTFVSEGIDLRLCTKTRPNTKTDPCTTK